MNVIWIWLTGLAFTILHSVFAMQRCKRIFYRLGLNARTYRLLYTLFATALTIVWLGMVDHLPDTPIYHIHGWASWLMTIIQIAGVGIVMLSLRSIDTFAFIGLSTNRDQDAFTERGIYRYVRHPMYLGVILALLFNPVQSMNSLNLFAVIVVYFVIGSKLEERRMLTIHPDYADYQRRVPAFIPYWPALCINNTD